MALYGGESQLDPPEELDLFPTCEDCGEEVGDCKCRNIIFLPLNSDHDNPINVVLERMK